MFAVRVRDAGVMPGDAVDSITAAYMDARYGDDGSAAARLREAVAAMA